MDDEIKRKPITEWDFVKALHLTFIGKYAIEEYNQCTAVDQLYSLDLKEKFRAFIEAVDKELADALGFYSVEDFYKYTKETDIQSDFSR